MEAKVKRKDPYMMSNKVLGMKSSVTDHSYLKKKYTDDLKSFNTSIIKYRNEHHGYAHSNCRNNNVNFDSMQVESVTDQDSINLSCSMQEYPTKVMQPALTHNNNNNNAKFTNYYNNRRSESKLLSPPPPKNDDFTDFGVHNGTNFSQSLISNRFSNSTPSVFYASTTSSNGPNNNGYCNGYCKPRYYSSGHKRDKRKMLGPSTMNEISRRVFGLMERFAARSYLFHIPATPHELIQPHQSDLLNRQIWDVYSTKGQKDVTYLRKLDFWKSVYLSIQKVMSRYGLFLVGSTMSGLGLDSSDIDMCLLVKPCLGDPRADALSHLQNICKSLEQCDFVKDPEVIMAKVPILKFRDTVYGFEVDLNCNNAVGIRNTHLLNAYARMDWRVRPLVVIVKVWAQANDINDAKRMTINSYSLALMTLHYLQCGVNPPVIPCLQVLYPDRFAGHLEIHSLDLQTELPPFYSDNKQALGELFLGFLHYFSAFNYNQFAMSVRSGAVLSKEECRFVRVPKNDCAQWKLLCIEEPFDLNNTARCVYDEVTFEHIKSVLRGSYETLAQTKDLSSIVPLHLQQLVATHISQVTQSQINQASAMGQVNHGASPPPTNQR